MSRHMQIYDEKLERPILETLGRLMAFLKPYSRRMAGVLALMLMTTAAMLILPVLVQKAIDEGLVARNYDALLLYSLLYMAVNLAEKIGLRFQLFNMVWIGQNVVMEIRKRIFYKYLDLDMAYYDHHRVGDMMARITEDSNALQNFVTWAVVNTIANVLTLVGIIVAMLLYDWSLALLTLIVMPMMIALTIWWRRQAAEKYRAVRKAVGKLSATLQESLAGMRVVQAFVREYRELLRFREAATDELRANLGADRLASMFFPGVDLISYIGMAIVVGVGGIRVLEGQLSAGTLAAFLLFLNRFFNPIRDLAMRMDQLQAAAAATERILNVLDTEPAIKDKPGARPLPRIKGLVEMYDVTFHYEGPESIREGTDGKDGSRSPVAVGAEDRANVLQDVTLRAEPGQTVALVGHTGAGKSTLVRLLGRFYEPQSGRILFDGVDISTVTLKSVRDQMAWVPQDTGLFATTVRENLRYGRLDATDDEIEAAARETGAHEFIVKLPRGYDTDVEEGGSRLSTGQRQLISFTRALLADPAIIVLDEATSSVDTITELQMQAALEKLLSGRTAFIIAHRLSTIVKADQVIVMDHGKIVERGTHEELLAAKGHYYRLYTAQLRGDMGD